MPSNLCKTCGRITINSDRLCDACWEIESKLADYLRRGGPSAIDFVARALGVTIKATPEQVEEQRLDFAYGNLACSTNHKPEKWAFWKLAESRGWTKERFEKWACGREWRQD